MQINDHPYTMNFIAYTQISIQIRRLLYQVSAILASFFLFGCPIQSPAQAATSEITFRQGMTDLPSGVIHSQSGEKYRLSDFKGTPLVINFWASWCAPCISELPELEILSTSLEEDNIQVMLVNLDRAGPKAGLPLLRTKQITSPLSLFDPKTSWAKHLQIRGLPFTIFIPADQRDYSYHLGPVRWSAPEVKSQLLAKLASN